MLYLLHFRISSNSVMADTRTVPLRIMSAWRKKKDWPLAIPGDIPHLLINTAYIPFVLDLGGLEILLCRMYSNMSGESSHILEGIQIPHEQCELDVLVAKVANMFTSPALQGISKRFLIKRLWTEQAGKRELLLATDVLVIAGLISYGYTYGYTASQKTFVRNISDKEYVATVENIKATVLHRSQVDCKKFNFNGRPHIFEISSHIFEINRRAHIFAKMMLGCTTAAAVGYIYRRSVASASKAVYS